jgi:hypothetical protein
MALLLVNALDGEQKLIEVFEGGSYCEPERVLWDERKDGPIPTGTVEGLGGWSREGDVLLLDTTKRDAQAARALLRKQAQEAKEQTRKDRRERFKAAPAASTLPELKAIVLDLLKELGHS